MLDALPGIAHMAVTSTIAVEAGIDKAALLNQSMISLNSVVITAIIVTILNVIFK